MSFETGKWRVANDAAQWRVQHVALWTLAWSRVGSSPSSSHLWCMPFGLLSAPSAGHAQCQCQWHRSSGDHLFAWPEGLFSQRLFSQRLAIFRQVIRWRLLTGTTL